MSTACNIYALLNCMKEVDSSFEYSEDLIKNLKSFFLTNDELKLWQKTNYPSINFEGDKNFTRLISAVKGFSLFFPQFTFRIDYDLDIAKLPIPCVATGDLWGTGYNHSVCIAGKNKDYFEVIDNLSPEAMQLSKEFAKKVLENKESELKNIVFVKK